MPIAAFVESGAAPLPLGLNVLVLGPRQTIHAIVGGRAWPGHPRAAAHALRVFGDARHKAGQDDYAEIKSAECIRALGLEIKTKLGLAWTDAR